MARVVGPPPPAPNWDRMDMRGLNGSRHAWGYISPDDKFITSDDGKVYIQVTKDMVTKKKGVKSATINLSSVLVRRLRHCLEWSKIVKRMFIFESKDAPDKKKAEFENSVGKELAIKLTKKRVEEKKVHQSRNNSVISWEELGDL
jgi:hypothetical protein